MKNLSVFIHCLLVDIADVQVQINTVLNKILFALILNDVSPTYSVNYRKNGLVITINNLGNLMESCDLIVDKLKEHGWLNSVIKIDLNDLESGQTLYLIPKSSPCK